MAIIKSGILGAFSGSVAQVNGYSNKGKAVIRAKKKANQNPKSRVLSANGQHLANLVKIYNLTKAEIARYMSLDLPDIDYNWNNFTKSFLTKGIFTQDKYMSLAILGNSQFSATQYFLPSNPLSLDWLRLSAQKLNSIRINYPDLRWNLRIVASYNNSTFTNSGDVKSNQIGTQANQPLPNVNDYSIMILWLSSASTGKRSAAAIAINTNLG